MNKERTPIFINNKQCDLYHDFVTSQVDDKTV